MFSKFNILLSPLPIGMPKNEFESWLNRQKIFPSQMRQGNGLGEAFIMFYTKALALDALRSDRSKSHE
jgi:hypothetical protein